MMVGDGDNDSAALVAANTGICVGTRSLACESADVVLLKGNLNGIAEAIELGRHVMSTARVGVKVGMGLSVLQMILAHVGSVSPVTNSCMQEVVDLGAILNSIRVLWYQPACLQ